MTQLAVAFDHMAHTFEAGRAPLYAHLAGSAAQELEDPDSHLAMALQGWQPEPPSRLFPLRLLGLIHRAVLAGELPDLALFYPSVGGHEDPLMGAWPLFRTAVIDRAERLPELLAGPHQHNEVGRAAALALGFMMAGRLTDRPIAILEVGCSAGLLLRWDRYLSSLWFPQMFAEPMPEIEGSVEVVDRRGCDLAPIEPTSPEGALHLRSLVWADLVDHMVMLNQGIGVAHEVPAQVDTADGAEWLPQQLQQPRPGVCTVVYHSLMRTHAPAGSVELMEETVRMAGDRATYAEPLAYLRFEPPPEYRLGEEMDPQRLVQVRLQVFPGGHDRVLATADVNGRHVRCCE